MLKNKIISNGTKKESKIKNNNFYLYHDQK